MTLPAWGISALVVGTSGGGKSTVAVGLVERLKSKGYAFCIIDPEGDYDAVEGAAVLGSPERAPSVDECMQLLAKPGENAVINLVGLKFRDRPGYFLTLFTRMRELRARTGRPHWLVVDEAHHVLPADWQPTDHVLPPRLDGVLLVSVAAASIAAAPLKLLDTVIVIGDKPGDMVREFARAIEVAAPEVAVEKVPEGAALLWHKASRQQPRIVTLEPTQTERKRHLRKYAEGSLGEDRSFYFRGPEGKLKLRAHNLIVFTDLADGVDDETWLYHWKRGEVSAWVRTSIKDEALGKQIETLERTVRDDAVESRKRVRELIEGTYTLPAEAAATQ